MQPSREGKYYIPALDTKATNKDITIHAVKQRAMKMYIVTTLEIVLKVKYNNI